MRVERSADRSSVGRDVMVGIPRSADDRSAHHPTLFFFISVPPTKILVQQPCFTASDDFFSFKFPRQKYCPATVLTALVIRNNFHTKKWLSCLLIKILSRSSSTNTVCRDPPHQIQRQKIIQRSKIESGDRKGWASDGRRRIGTQPVRVVLTPKNGKRRRGSRRFFLFPPPKYKENLGAADICGNSVFCEVSFLF